MPKKGSLNLSINAIVVLILAVTLLSLGLTFINKTFGGATEELEKSLGGIGEDRISQLKSKCDDSACLEFSTMTIRRNNLEKNLLVLNNRLDCDINSPGVTIEIGGPNQEECQILGGGADATKCKDHIDIETFSPQPVGAKEKVVVPIEVTPKNNAETTTYRYKVAISGNCGTSVLSKNLYLDIVVE
jgi:hypothetical protein